MKSAHWTGYNVERSSLQIDNDTNVMALIDCESLWVLKQCY